MKFYGYWRSSTSYRVRIALNLKDLTPELIPVNLLKAEHKSPAYIQLNPQRRLPSLIDNGHVLMQSLAIIEYLEEKYPEPPLLPLSPHERAYVRAIALNIACDISPLGNLAPRMYLREQLGASEQQQDEWIRHWIAEGFQQLEELLASSPYTGTFCHGAAPTLADCCLVPQLYNARRYHMDLSPYPTIVRIDAACAKLPAFITAHPTNQPDAA